MTHDADAARTPAPVMGLYDGPMWSGIRDGAMQLQRCTECGEPAVEASRCLKHLIKARERQRKNRGLKRRYYGTLSYKLELAAKPKNQRSLKASRR